MSDLLLQEHILYRWWSGEDLLYVGISVNAYQRAKQHSKSAVWWQFADRMTLERFPTRPSVLEAELKAIQEEHPKYNIAGVGSPVGQSYEAEDGRLFPRTLRQFRWTGLYGILWSGFPENQIRELFRVVDDSPSGDGLFVRRYMFPGLNEVASKYYPKEELARSEFFIDEEKWKARVLEISSLGSFYGEHGNLTHAGRIHRGFDVGLWVITDNLRPGGSYAYRILGHAGYGTLEIEEYDLTDFSTTLCRRRLRTWDPSYEYFDNWPAFRVRATAKKLEYQERMRALQNV